MTRSPDRIQVPAPKFAINDVIYIRESAASTGILEAVRITNIGEFARDSNQWTYRFTYSQRPAATQTVGDRIDLKNTVSLVLFEDEIVTLCEALPLQIGVLERRLDNAKLKLKTFCS